MDYSDISRIGRDASDTKFFSKMQKVFAGNKDTSAPVSSNFWALLSQDSFQPGQIIMAMPWDVREQLQKLTGQGLPLEDVVVIFLLRLFDKLDKVHYSRQLAREIRNKFDRIRFPDEFDKNLFERTLEETVDRLSKQLSY